LGPCRFTGRDWDAESGLYYFRMRYCEPRSGRFLSEDPAQKAQAFEYAGNDPVNYIDPGGLLKSKPGVAAASEPLLSMLKCTEECLGAAYEIRITETTGNHPSGNPHTRGVAADFTVGPADPFISPAGPVPARVSPKDVCCCARMCTFKFCQYEGWNTPGATAPHYHAQIPPGQGGTERPTDSDCCGY